MSENHTLRGVLCAFIGAVGWGFSGACGQYLLSNANLPSIWITTIRMFFAGIILVSLNILQHRKKAFDILKSKKNLLTLFFFAVFGLVLSQFTYLSAISYSNAGTATVLQDLGPVFIMMYVCAREKRLPRIFEFISIIFAFTGVVLLATHGDFTTLKLSKECLFWGILSALGLVFYSIIPKQLTKDWGAVTVTGYGMLIGGTILLIPQIGTIHIDLTPSTFAALAVMVVVGTVLSYTMYLQGVKDIKEIKTSMIACVEPVSASIFSYFWFKTKFLPIDIISFVLILSTVFILNIKKK